MLILQFTKLLTIMRKLLFLLLTIAIFTSCDKKNNPTPNNPKPEDEYPNLIVGNWKLIKSIIYYTPMGGGAETSFDATAQEGTNYYKFNTDNTLYVSETSGGTPESKFNYVLTGSNLKLTDQSSSEVFNVTIKNLTNTQLKWEHSNGSGSTLYDALNNAIGTINYTIVDFTKQ